MSSLIQQVAFPSIDRFLFCVKAFRFGVVPFVYFYFFPCLRRQIQKNIVRTDVKVHTAYAFF